MRDILKFVETTLQNLENNKKLPTPENYEKEFFEVTKKADLLIEDRIEFEEIIETLCKKEKLDFFESDSQSFKTLAQILIKRVNQQEVKLFLSELSHYMSPSLNKEIEKDIEKICTEISYDPNALIADENTRKLRSLTNQRIKNDRSTFNEKNDDVKKLVKFLARLFNKTVEDNCMTIEKIVEIKDEIKTLKLSNSSFKHLTILHDKLLDTIEKFDETVKNNNILISHSQKETEELYNEIEKLKVNLNKAEEEKSIDFLTEVLTRRAYSIEVDRIENEFNIFDSNYALVFYDIDHFKKINDTYGHDCGDKVLKTFAKILKKLTRSEDVICRFGGEEFICIIHYKNILEIKNYLKRVKNIINNNKFVYNNEKFNIEFSAGVTFRKKYNSYSETLRKADDLLYIAKKNGRNKIILDNDDII